ncbi:MAG: LON peptidase substrate-binding domain-containing protein [Candidatus Sumerlaeota bacterium]|nr:LON peptidase substrate-binding domain-containing protein [Candidatus Sumerlaeota bacterium]
MTPESLYVPIMPLPNVILFPQSLLPLYIFEPRYIKLVEAILGGDRLMAVALLKDGWKKTYYDSPPVQSIVGIGKIIQHEKLGDGKFNIWLSGVERAKIIHEVQEKPFRVAKARRIPDLWRPSRAQAVTQARRDLSSLLRALAKARQDLAPQLRRAMDEQICPGSLADYIAHILCGCVYDKYCFLCEANPERRLRLAAVQARIQLSDALSRQTAAFPLPAPAEQEEELTLDE